MRRYMFDTGSANDWIDRNGATRERAIRAVRDGHMLGICTPVLAELWSGVEYSQSRDANIPRLRHALAQLTEWPLTPLISISAKTIYAF